MSEDTSEKKNTGYTYWKREIPDAHLLPSSAPQKIPHSSSEESLLKANRTSSSGLVSAWNAGTTYEEKNITEKAKSVVTDILLSKSFVESNRFEIGNWKGEVHAHHVRGKVKIGYELSELDLTSDEKEIKIRDIDSTDPEGFSVDSDGGFGKGKIKALVVQLMNDMCSTLLAE